MQLVHLVPGDTRTGGVVSHLSWLWPVQVREPETGRVRPRALHPRLPEARRALQRYQQVLSGLDPIPRVLHASFKYDDLNVSESTQPTIVHGLQAFQRHNPRWRVEVSSDTQLDTYLRRHLAADDYARVAPLHPVEKTDVWRLLKMYREGGIYSDIDRRWNVDVRSFISNATRLVLPTQHGFGISTTEQAFDFSQDFMCSARHNPLFKDALEHVLAQRRKCDERCMLIDPRPHTPACKLPRKQRAPSHCGTLDFGPGAWFRAVTKNLWGEAWLTYSANKSFLRVQRQDDTYPAHPTRARVPARGNTAAHCLDGRGRFFQGDHVHAQARRAPLWRAAAAAPPKGCKRSRAPCARQT